MAFAQLIERVEKLDEHRVRFVLRHPEAPFLADLAMGFTSIYSAEYAAKLLATGTPDALNSQPVGTGLRLPALRQGRPGALPRQPRLLERQAAQRPPAAGHHPDPNVRIQQLRAGACQVALYPKPTDVPALRGAPGVKLVEQDALMVAYVALNTRHPPLDDVRVRQAINLAFDRKSYIRAQYGEGAASAAVNPYPATLLGYNSDLDPWPHDPERARQLLAEAGHASGLKLSIWTRPGGGPTNPNPGIGAQMLQADLAAIGIQADIRVFEWGELIKRAKNGEHDLVFMGWVGDNGDPDNFLTPTSPAPPRNQGEPGRLVRCEIRRPHPPGPRGKRPGHTRPALPPGPGDLPRKAPGSPRPPQAVQRPHPEVEGFRMSPLGSNNFATTRLKAKPDAP